MTPTQAELYRRVRNFAFDEGDEALPFAHRLARENGWSLTYARRVLVEYKKFTFLAMAASHPVTPSEEVDQAWHLHLTYTRSYWERFCPHVLGGPLHHEPTRGGPDEHKKFVEQYNRTLESYRRVFEEEPPADVWPVAGRRFGPDVRSQWVNMARNWVIPRSLVKRLLWSATLASSLLLLIAGCGPLLIADAGGMCIIFLVILGVLAAIIGSVKSGGSGGSKGGGGSSGGDGGGGGWFGGGCGGGDGGGGDGGGGSGCGGGGCGGGGAG